ncbi:hypothetical protein L1F30_13280 [Simiduia sp. 21SJ11W-1]|uniref:hypothetical protein n=1 Tax=Simiduia sp. 21SJ11W-1 TaxID=2909669 RepID=UPI0020A0DB03|nr:hypothetical protein [Simiduia sp. 21SJ11W-1]UTA47129.1 hypothetical protein L1F30_13280 [Simiduia sp. 21SJ11W-1]
MKILRVARALPLFAALGSGVLYGQEFSPRGFQGVAASEAHSESQRESIPLYYYHDKPPYIVDPSSQQGDYFELVSHLNNVPGGYHFYLEYLPRNRVDRKLSQGQLDGPVIGVNPLWFKDPDEQRYWWTSAIFNDRDIFVSKALRPFEFVDASSLHGKLACLVLGNYYVGVSEAVSEGVLRQIKTTREEVVLEMLDQDRCDFGIVSESLFRYWQASHTAPGSFYVARQPHDEFQRRILVPRSRLTLFLHLQQALEAWPVTQN